MSMLKNNPEGARNFLRGRDGDDCWLCGKPIDFTRQPGTFMGPSIDHVVPRAAGGSNRLSNLRLAHMYPCNQGKGSKHDGINWARLMDPGQTAEALAEAAARQARREHRKWFESFSAARSA